MPAQHPDTTSPSRLPSPLIPSDRVRWMMSSSVLVITVILAVLTGVPASRAGWPNLDRSRPVLDGLQQAAQPTQSAPDSVVADSLRADSLAVDTTTVFDAVFDSTGTELPATPDSTRKKGFPAPRIIPPDTSAPLPLTLAALRLTNREWHRSGFKDAGEAMLAFPGLYGRHPDLYGHPFYLVPPGGNARDLGVVYNRRPYGEPVTGATNWTTLVPEEIRIAEYSAVGVPELPSSGPVMRWIRPYAYPSVPTSRVVYRQGWYGVGRADVLLRHQMRDDFAYHLGINIGEFQGRYNNTASNTSHLRIGGRQTLRGIGHLTVEWMQARSRWGRPYSGARMSFHRNDIDVMLSSGDPDSVTGAWQEAAFWYVRSQTGYGYGDEDGNRLGARVEGGRQFGELHEVRARLDAERVAARFPRRARSVDPQARRMVTGLSLTDRVEAKRFSVQASGRVEGSWLSLDPDTTDVDPTLLMGGSVTGEYPLIGRLKAIGLLSSSWRHPGLDELGGYWSVRSPDRWMDVFAVPDYTTYSIGNQSLKPVKTDFVGGGLWLDWLSSRQVYLLSGLRNWRDRIQTVQLDEETWSRVNLPDTQTYETTLYAWVPVYGPVSVAGTWTWAERVASNAAVPQMQGMASLRFHDFYYNGQLRIRATVNVKYLGSYNTGTYVQPSATMLETLINAKVFDFEVYYGTSNILGASYHYIPYYPNMHRTELWGVRWVLYK